MSWASRGGVKIIISISAQDAIYRCEDLLRLLTQVGEFQEAEIAAGTGREISQLSEDTKIQALYAMLKSFSLTDDVILNIIPDQRSPNSSGYGYYSSPNKLGEGG